VDTGDFSDALDFIEILTPPTPPDTVDAAKTTYANTEGVVSTLDAENLRASPSVDGGAPFLEWKKIVPTEAVDSDRNVDLAQYESGEIWFAFYQTQSAGTAIRARPIAFPARHRQQLHAQAECQTAGTSEGVCQGVPGNRRDSLDCDDQGVGCPERSERYPGEGRQEVEQPAPCSRHEN
jgi:hypothetical protein